MTKKISSYGSTFHYNSIGQNHRSDGPAIEWENGGKEWWVNNKIHRLDGPAIIWANGEKDWYYNDKLCLKSEHNRLVLFFVLEPRRIALNPIEEDD